MSVGTVFSQFLNFAMLPLMTRLFVPHDFAVFALFSGASWILVVFATLQMEHLIILPKSHVEGRAIFQLVLISGLVQSLCLLILIHLFVSALAPIIFKVTSIKLRGWVYLSPCLVFAGALNQALRYMAIRVGRFKSIGLGTFGMTFVVNLIAIGGITTVGKLSDDSWYLISGQIAGMLANSAFIYADLKRADINMAPVSLARLRCVFSKVKSRAAHLAIAYSMMTAFVRLPVVCVGAVGVVQATGVYALVERLVEAPSNLLARAIGDAFRNRSARSLERRELLGPLVLKIVKRAALIGIPTYGCGILIAPLIFGPLFGKAWADGGYYASILLVGEMFAFIDTTVNPTAILMKMDRYIVSWHFCRLASELGVLGMALTGHLGIYGVIVALSGVKVVSYSIDLGVIYWKARALDAMNIG